MNYGLKGSNILPENQIELIQGDLLTGYPGLKKQIFKISFHLLLHTYKTGFDYL